ncbi:MAG: hypothetical protein AAF919_18125 [Pseudomonadota bacterium]
MTLLHMSITARSPKAMAEAIARLSGGTALPFPPCPGAWIAFTADDDGTAVEVYPSGTRLARGAKAVSFQSGPPDRSPSATHLALASPLDVAGIETVAEAAGWLCRRCDRGPFECLEIWTGEDLLLEVLDPSMLAAYRRNMTTARWRDMFGLDVPQ